MNHDYRKLSLQEIDILKQNRCHCDDWNLIDVAIDFSPSRIENTVFSGIIKLGSFKKDFLFPGGVVVKSGIFNAKIHNCTIGNDVFIHQINNYMANYCIEDEVIIENLNFLAVTEKTSFGNGTEVAVLIEPGGREFPIYDGLSALIAYILTFYRYKPEVIKRIENFILSYIGQISSEKGIVGKGSQIQNCHQIKNVKIGPGANLEGVIRLENGSINSHPDASVSLGAGVIAENFIINSDTIIKDGVILINCFVGQGCRLGKQFYAENSVFFANCDGFQGEVFSIFAGPYTVTHHKSTLLIAGMFSFFNAGSSTNQSNHFYKLGPLHQGILERGCKTGSSSYLLWPARAGAFTIVVGKHYQNFDTSNLPFSLIIESHGESILIPAANLRSIGNFRDGCKWPARDRRNKQHRKDLINCAVLNPYIVQKLINGCKLLEDFQKQTEDVLCYQNLKIKKSSVAKGISYYRLGIIKFLGDCIIKRLDSQNIQNKPDLQALLSRSSEIGIGEWIDLAGFLAPKLAIERLFDEFKLGKFPTLADLEQAFIFLHEKYDDFEWNWALSKLEQELGKQSNSLTPKDLIQFIKNWKKLNIEFKELLFCDAQKEYSESLQIGFGIDGDAAERQVDFQQVRGDIAENIYLQMLSVEFEKQQRQGEAVIFKLQQIESTN
ncbi:DUF4954 family protein [candidate division KSB1 bacterium]|nr:DUF4954 family protein [candidate division KSB1 bacterium]